ncbi:unnamed protein product [Aphanomyces euteiches]
MDGTLKMSAHQKKPPAFKRMPREEEGSNPPGKINEYDLKAIEDRLLQLEGRVRRDHEAREKYKRAALTKTPSLYELEHEAAQGNVSDERNGSRTQGLQNEGSTDDLTSARRLPGRKSADWFTNAVLAVIVITAILFALQKYRKKHRMRRYHLID